MPEHTEDNGNALGSRAKWVFAVFAIIGGYFLFVEHRAHVLPYLPWLILLACPLMHLFMHGGHGGHRGHHGSGDRLHNGNGGSSGTKTEGSRDGDAAPNGESPVQHGGRP